MFEDLIIDRTLEDVQNRTAKGHYNASDLNRVEHAAKQISEMLTKEAYPVVYQPHKRLMTIDTQDKNALLLIHSGGISDKSSHKRSITNEGVTSSDAQSIFGDAALYFNGNSRLLIENDESLNFGDGDFTIDWWEYSPTSTNKCRFNTHYSDTYWTGMVWGYNGTGCYIQSTATTNEWDLLNNWPGMDVVQNKWVHRAVVRSGNNIISFKNGKIALQTTISGAIYHNSDYKFVIGDYITKDKNMFTGYIDEFRVSNIARWTTNFTPPTERYEVDNYTLMLINAVVKDDSIYNQELINYGATEQTLSGSLNDKVIYFNSNYLEINSNSWIDFGADWTIEWREYRTGYSSSSSVFYTNFNSSARYGGILIGHIINKQLQMYIGNVQEQWNLVHGFVIDTIELNKWNMYAIVKHGNTITAYKNGTAINETTLSGEIIANGTPTIGFYSDGSRKITNAYIEEFRISNVARYSKNFTPPTEPFVVETKSEELTDDDWVEPENYADIPDHPTETEMNRYLNNIKEIKRQFYQKQSTPPLPDDMNKLTYSDANAIEQLIIDTNDRLIDVEKIKRKSGTFKAGELLP